MAAASESVKGLNEFHLEQVDGILRFLRQKRQKQIKEVEMVFQDVKDDRLVEDNYNTEDVTSIIDHASNMVTSSMETELCHLAYTQALVVRQLLTQGEVHEFTLSIDESELENQKAINDMKLYDEEKTKNNALSALSLGRREGTKPILQQLNESQAENKKLKAQLESAVSETASIQSKLDASSLSDEGKLARISALEAELSVCRGNSSASGTLPAGTPPHSGVELAPLPSCGAAPSTSGEVKPPGGDPLSEAKLALTLKEQELQDVTLQLTKRVQETTQFVNMQKMMTKKDK